MELNLKAIRLAAAFAEETIHSMEGHDDDLLLKKAGMLKGTDAEGWWIGHLVERAVELRRNVLSTQPDRNEVERLRAALRYVALCAEQYNHVGWQRIVGRMQKRAIEALEIRQDHDP